MANAKPARKIAPRKTPGSKTPAKTRERRANARGFVIEHRKEWHDHFDLRLECDGVLKSWAVPNGPPEGEAAPPRIAVRMDDVPMRESEENTLWDSGTWEPAAASDPAQDFADGRIAFQLRGERIEGGFSLIRLRDDTGRKQGKENWLLKAERR
jgi:bifunctional non-homologous end joining protein LigD